MNFKDVGEFIAFLESKGELIRITTPVSSYLEITEVADRVVKEGGPALLFENVEGHSVPIAINLYGSAKRASWALGVEHLDELGNSDAYTLRRIAGRDRGFDWGDV